jgi:hypothetical protein
MLFVKSHPRSDTYVRKDRLKILCALNKPSGHKGVWGSEGISPCRLYPGRDRNSQLHAMAVLNLRKKPPLRISTVAPTAGLEAAKK